MFVGTHFRTGFGVRKGCWQQIFEARRPRRLSELRGYSQAGSNSALGYPIPGFATGPYSGQSRPAGFTKHTISSTGTSLRIGQICTKRVPVTLHDGLPPLTRFLPNKQSRNAGSMSQDDLRFGGFQLYRYG